MIKIDNKRAVKRLSKFNKILNNLNNKINEFYEDFLLFEPIIAGGCVRDALLNKNWNDIDIFINCNHDYDKLYLTSIGINVIPQLFILSPNCSNFGNYGNKLGFQLMKNLSLPAYIKDVAAFNKGIFPEAGLEFQIITRNNSNSIKDIIDSFDFTCNQFYYDGENIFGLKEAYILLQENKFKLVKNKWVEKTPWNIIKERKKRFESKGLKFIETDYYRAIHAQKIASGEIIKERGLCYD
jgi:hypothetical protein